MYDKRPPKGPKNPYLKYENKASPVGIQISKKSLKMRLVPAEVLHKWCLWEAQEMRKMMVALEFQFGLSFIDM